MPIALLEFPLDAEFLGILILEADGGRDLLDHILVGRRVITGGRFVADEIRGLRSASTSPPAIPASVCVSSSYRPRALF